MDSTLVRENQRLSKSMVLLTIAISGGPFKQGYNVLKGIDRYIPVERMQNTLKSTLEFNSTNFLQYFFDLSRCLSWGRQNIRGIFPGPGEPESASWRSRYGNPDELGQKLG